VKCRLRYRRLLALTVGRLILIFVLAVPRSGAANFPADERRPVPFRFLAAAFSLLLLSAGKPHPAAPSTPTVHLAGGAIAGATSGSITVFKGIPYAQPPIGPLRWREPQPVSPWPGVRDATQPSHPCMQSLAGTDSFIQPLAAEYGATYSVQKLDPSEDCLYLNIWTPQLQPGPGLPVMVWLHGGSNRVGSGSEPGYDGTALAKNGVIVVTINYRLGIMGFFAHPELTAESPHHSSGNYGLLDQIAALRWVQQNIAQFGGDPGNVTLFGESAGSVDSTILITSPLTWKLFRRVIAESGPAFGLGQARTVAYMEPLGMAVGKEAGAKSGSQLALLRGLPAPELAEIENRLIATTFKGYDPNASIIDGWVLPQSPARAYALGKLQPVDLLAGLNAREFSAFRVVAAAAASKLPQPAPKPGVSAQISQFADTARPLYGHWTNIAVTTYFARILMHGAAAVDQATNDIGVACPVGAEAALTNNAGHHAFVYLFIRSVPGKGESDLGSFHSLELPYVFGSFQVRTFNWLPFNSTDFQLSKIIQAYWTNFARSGDPNGPGLPRWVPWNTDKEPYMTFSQKGDAVPQEHFSPIYCHLSPSRLKDQLENY
jgi:para-nitrobenzyl esterase